MTGRPDQPDGTALRSLPPLPTMSARPGSGSATPPPPPPRPGWHGRVVVAVVALLAVAVVATIATVTADEPSDDPGLPPIEAPASVLSAGEDEVDRYLRSLTPRGIEVTTGDLSCWFAHASSEAGPADQLWCGPAVFADSDDGTSWLHVPLDFSEVDGRTIATVGDIESRRTFALQPGQELRRLERDRRLTADDVDLLGRPGVGTAPAATVGFLPAADVMLELDAPSGGSGAEWQVSGSGRRERVFLPDGSNGAGAIVAASPGEEWLLVQLAAGTSPESELEIVVDGSRRIPVAVTDDEDVVAVSIPLGVQSVALVLDGITVAV